MVKLFIAGVWFSRFAAGFCAFTSVWLLSQGDYRSAFVQFMFAVTNGFMAKYNSDNLKEYMASLGD